MSNMSYCRFENTARDLEDCRLALEGLFGSDPEAGSLPLSEDELRAAKEMLETALEMVLMVADAAELPCEDLDGADAATNLGIAVAMANEAFEEERTCEWCGFPERPDDPLVRSIVSPPVDGYAVEEGMYHKKCAAEAADASVR